MRAKESPATKSTANKQTARQYPLARSCSPVRDSTLGFPDRTLLLARATVVGVINASAGFCRRHPPSRPSLQAGSWGCGRTEGSLRSILFAVSQLSSADLGLLRLDVVFDPVGGKSVKKGMKLLNAGGRMVIFGASSMTSARNIFKKLGILFGFGFYSPIGLLSPSKSIIGVNMLRIADHKPDTLARVLAGTVDLAARGVIQPRIGGYFSIDQLAEAHDNLEKRKTMGKLAVHW